MNQDPNFPRFGQQPPHQYGLHSFDTLLPKRGIVEKVFGEEIARKFSSPLFSTAAFVIAGVAFAGVIFAVYPDSDSQGDVPVVQAETLAYKEIPAEPGGMSIPNRDSTVFSAMSGQGMDEPALVENLLAEEEPVDKLAAFARQVEETMEEERGDVPERAEEVVDDISTMASAEDEETAPFTLQKISGQSEEAATQEVAQVGAPNPLSPVDEDKRPKIIHKPGENPETLDFVRSVLDQKDSRVATVSAPSASDVAMRAAAVAPAAGNAAREVGRDFNITPGSYYVQLGSVKSLDGAESEWGRLVKEFDAELGRVSHRVQAAELGDRGTFYRIQAGPMSKTSAADICDLIKAQKPGGCLITQ